MNDKRRVFVDDIKDGADKGFKGWTLLTRRKARLDVERPGELRLAIACLGRLWPATATFSWLWLTATGWT
jgi:hypothetical protein